MSQFVLILVKFQILEFHKTRKVCSQNAEIRIRIQNDPKDIFFVLELQNFLTQNTKQHITQNTCAQHTNHTIQGYFIIQR